MWSTILNINIRAMTSIWISFILACSCSLSWAKLYTYGELYEHLPFKENETYIPQRFIDYIATLIEKDGNRYMTTANMYNQIDYDVDHGVLYIMRLLTTPTTKEKLIEDLDVNVTVERTTKDGQQYRVPSEQYLDEVLRHLRVLGFFRK